jgi:riboflavin kinase/FMN adenylyltransferase
MAPEDFVQRVLVDRLSAREVWVGPEFRFGHRRAGDLALLQALGATHGFTADSIAPVVAGGERVSSTALRQQLAAGDLEGAARELGRRYAISGKVVRGKQLGRTLGYPTANIRLAGKRPALSGIYATWVHGIGPSPMASVSSLGTRPTVQGVEPLLEAHVFDFEGDLYGRRLEVEFVAKLRDEEKFNDLPALVRQMDLDAAQARRVLRHDKQESGALA